MRFARGLLIFSYGLFSIAAQTLLFREFITTFEGNDISVGIFFSSWFLWVALGAMLVRRAKAFAERLLGAIEFLFLAHVPAFILQAALIIQARELAGIESYGLWSIRDILLISIIVNAPVSIITGMLFPLACRWVGANSLQQEERLPVSYVYTIEAAGSFVGGIGVTVLLGLGVSSARIFFLLALALSASVFAVQLASARMRHVSGTEGSGLRTITCALSFFLVPLFVCVCLFLGADRALAGYVQVAKWTKLLPKDALLGSFQTAQAEYLYGTYQDQWVAVREGSVVEALPDQSSAGRIAAISLCQKPDARKILVIGSGLGLCHEFLRLPQVETVTWTHCDNQYVRKINEFIPAEFKDTARQRLHPFAGDICSLLAEKRELFDIVILNLPEATSSVLNRYYTLEFYRQIKESLNPDGVLQVRTAGGENIMGTELVNLGASTKLTLERVFSRLVLTPGEDTWFIASDSESLSGEPGTLRDRFAAIEGASQILAPEALLSVYLPDRAAKALEYYSSVELPEEFLINRDSRPLTHLYSLLLAAKQSGAPAARLAKYLALAGPLVFLVPLVVLAALRVIYVLRTGQQGSLSSFDSSFLVFSAGAVGIGAVIVLMYLYQTRFGSLYLHIGVVSSLFMAGLTAGAALISYLVKRISHPVTLGESRDTAGFTLQASLLFAIILAHTLILAAIALWPGSQSSGPADVMGSALQSSHLPFAVAFIVCGLCAGGYFPIAAAQLAGLGFETGLAGSKLETADHIGASLGGVVTSLALVPVLGARTTLLVFIAFILVNTPLAALRIFKPEKAGLLYVGESGLRRLGYVLFGVGASIVVCSNLLAVAGARLRPSLPSSAAQALAGDLRIEEQSGLVSDNSRTMRYFNVYDANDKLTGYIFSSNDLAPEVRGFGGRMNLAIYVDDSNGRLIDFHILRSNETPAYLELLSEWRDSLGGRRLFGPEPFADIHAVTGATISSQAVLSALQTSGRRFAAEILGRAMEQGSKDALQAGDRPDVRGVRSVIASASGWFVIHRYEAYLVGALVLTLVVIYRGGFWSRLAVLLFNLVLGGIVLNAQYSSEQIASLLSLHIPAFEMTSAFLLIIGVPLLAVIFGNIYCGYICPFGIVQELLGYILPVRLRQPIPAESMRKARFVKYVILFVLITVFFLSRNRTTLVADPLISVFSFRSSILNWQLPTLVVVCAALLSSVFYRRFWCRYLCPVGAFLSLLNSAVVLKRYLPTKKFGRCEFGCTARDQIDCIHCDKCRYEVPPAVRTKEQRAPGVFLTCVAIAAVFVATVSVSRFLQVIPTGVAEVAVSASGGQTRDVDIQRIREMIRQGQLSDKEAEFYEKLD